VTSFEAEPVDISTRRLRHPQPVERQQRDQGVLGGRPESGGNEQRSDLVSVQAGGM